MAKSDSHARDAIPSLGAGSHAAGARPIVRLLIISDHERHRSELRTEAEQAGFDIRIAPDASRAIESDRLDWNPDAVLLDQLLPRSDQYAAIRALRSAFGVPAFVVSDAGDAAYPFDRDVHLSPRQQIIAEARLFNAVVTSTPPTIVAVPPPRPEPNTGWGGAFHQGGVPRPPPLSHLWRSQAGHLYRSGDLFGTSDQPVAG